MITNILQRLASRPRPGLASRRVRWAAAAQAGLFAGGILFLVLWTLSVTLYDESPWRLLRMIAATVRGPQSLATASDFNFAVVATGLAVHAALSLLYAFALACLMVDMKRSMAPWLGLAMGIGLYYMNLYGFTQLFPWFEELRSADTLAAHAVFGLLLAQAYWAFASEQRSR